MDREIVKAGPYRRVQCVVTARDVTIPLIASIPTTTDSSEPQATWSCWFEAADGSRKFDWLTGFQLNHVFGVTTDWQSIWDDNNPQGIHVPSGGVSYDQMVAYVQTRINQVSGATVATGMDTLVAGAAVTILSALVAVNSPIDAIPLGGSDITGRLRPSNIVPGVSFDISSDNGADSGNFKWYIYP